MWASLVIITAFLPYRLAGGAPDLGPAEPGDAAYWIKLAAVSPSDGELMPSFDPEIADYTLIITNPDVASVVFVLKLNFAKYITLGMPTLQINNEPFKYSALEIISKTVSLNEAVDHNAPFDQTLSITVADPGGPQGFLVKTTRSFTYNIRIRQPALYKKVVLMESLYVTGCSDQPDSVCKANPGEEFAPDKDVIMYSVPSKDRKVTIHYKCNDLAVSIFQGQQQSKSAGTVDVNMDRYRTTEDISCRYVEKVNEFGLSTKDKMYSIQLLQPSVLSAESLHLNFRMLPRFGYCRMENSLKDPRWVCRAVGTETGFVSTYTDPHATVFLVNPDGTKRYKFELGIPNSVQLPQAKDNEIAWKLEVEGGLNVLSYPVEIKIAAHCSTLVCPIAYTHKTFEKSDEQAHLCDGTPCNVKVDAVVCCTGKETEWDLSWYKIEDLAGKTTVPNGVKPTNDIGPNKAVSAIDLAKVAERLKIDVTKADIDAMIAAVDGRGATAADGKVDSHEVGELINRIDIDKELVELFKTEVTHEGDPEKAFKIWDPNGDKGVTIAELEAAMKRPELSKARPITADDMIKKADADHDGFLSREELNVLVKKYAGEHSLYELLLAGRWEMNKEAAGVEDHPIKIVVPAKVEPEKPKALTTIEMIVRDLDVTGDNKVRASGLLVWAKGIKKEGADISVADLGKMVVEVDKDKDGGLDPAEFAAMVMTTEGHDSKLFEWLGAGIHKLKALDAFTRLLQDLVPVAVPVATTTTTTITIVTTTIVALVDTSWLDLITNGVRSKAVYFYNYGCGPVARTDCSGDTYYYEPACSDPYSRDGAFGCWAAGINQNCKFCGFDQYVACPGDNVADLCVSSSCWAWDENFANLCEQSFGFTCPDVEPTYEQWVLIKATYSLYNDASCYGGGGEVMGKGRQFARRFEDKAKPAEAESSLWRRLVSSSVLGIGLLATAVLAVVSLQRRRSQVGGARYVPTKAMAEGLLQE